MSVLSRIAGLSRTIEFGYPRAVYELARDREALDDARTAPEGSALRRNLADTRSSFRQSQKLVDDWHRELAELGELVFKHLPTVAARLRIVSPVTGTVQGTPGDVDALVGELRTIQAAAAQAEMGLQGKPKTYLTSWAEILDALGLKKDQRTKVVKFNKDFVGPIVVEKQGAQPRVELSTLLAWYNGVEARFQELQQRHRDKQATMADQYGYGSEGTVVPEISGSVKRRRRDAKR